MTAFELNVFKISCVCSCGPLSPACEAFGPGALLEGEMLAHARKVWETVSRSRITISSLHRLVSESLTRMG